MKNLKKSTWISILCVLLALAASQIYGTMRTERAEQETLTLVSDVQEVANTAPTPAPQIAPTPTPVVPAEKEREATEVANIDAPPSPTPLTFLLPAPGEIQTPYSETELVYFSPLREWRTHLGIDFLPAETDAVFSVNAGCVERIFEDHLYGTTIVLAHDGGYKSYYASLSEVNTQEGATVSAGQTIGRMGQTAPAESGVHLHFSMEKDGKIINPFSAG